MTEIVNNTSDKKEEEEDNFLFYDIKPMFDDKSAFLGIEGTLISQDLKKGIYKFSFKNTVIFIFCKFVLKKFWFTV